MAHVISRARVTDFDRFLETFTTRGKAHRSEHGSRGARVFRSTADPSEVMVIFDWDEADAKRFLDDPGTREIMQEAGLEAPPEMNYVEHVTDVES